MVFSGARKENDFGFVASQDFSMKSFHEFCAHLAAQSADAGGRGHGEGGVVGGEADGFVDFVAEFAGEEAEAGWWGGGRGRGSGGRRRRYGGVGVDVGVGRRRWVVGFVVVVVVGGRVLGSSFSFAHFWRFLLGKDVRFGLAKSFFFFDLILQKCFLF